MLPSDEPLIEINHCQGGLVILQADLEGGLLDLRQRDGVVRFVIGQFQMC